MHNHPEKWCHHHQTAFQPAHSQTWIQLKIYAENWRQVFMKAPGCNCNEKKCCLFIHCWVHVSNKSSCYKSRGGATDGAGFGIVSCYHVLLAPYCYMLAFYLLNTLLGRLMTLLMEFMSKRGPCSCGHDDCILISKAPPMRLCLILFITGMVHCLYLYSFHQTITWLIWGKHFHSRFSLVCTLFPLILKALVRLQLAKSSPLEHSG